MAITKLCIYGPQPAATTTGRTTSIGEDWICILDGQATPSAVLALLRDGVEAYDFPSITEGTQNAGDPTVKAVNLSVKRLENTSDQSKFLASVTYTNNTTTLSNSNDPLEAQPQITADFVDRLVVVERETVARNGVFRQIANSAGTQIIVEENEPIQKVTIVRNESDYRLSNSKAHAGKLNQEAVVILGETFSPYNCLLQRWSGTNQYDADGNLYWQVTYEILINDGAFSKSFIQKGRVNKHGLAPAFAGGIISSEEYKLDADGLFLDSADQENHKVINITDEFLTIQVSNWGPAVRLQDSPALSINELSGGS